LGRTQPWNPHTALTLWRRARPRPANRTWWPTPQQFFGATRPASTLVQVAALAVPGLLVEVEAIAGIPRGRA
jgi:enamine deaminase RidA (YjgF/YER057c/UK114 family)